MKSMGIELGFAEHDDPPMFDGFCRSPDLDREIILGGQAVDGVETITSFVYGKPEAYEQLLDRQETVREYELTPSDDGFFVYLRQDLGEDGLSLLNALSRETVVIVPPIEIRSDRTIRMTIVGHAVDLASVIDELSAVGTLDVLWVGNDVTVTQTGVSDRQQEALQTAWDVGYYEIPRRAGIEIVAEELDCAVSTASELIRRGQARLVGQQLNTQSIEHRGSRH